MSEEQTVAQYISEHLGQMRMAAYQNNFDEVIALRDELDELPLGYGEYFVSLIHVSSRENFLVFEVTYTDTKNGGVAYFRVTVKPSFIGAVFEMNDHENYTSHREGAFQDMKWDMLDFMRNSMLESVANIKSPKGNASA